MIEDNQELDIFLGKINDAADVITAKLIEASPEAADALLNLVQMQGIFNLICCFVFIILAAISCRFCVNLAKAEGKCSYTNDGLRYAFGAMASGIAFVFFSVSALVGILSFEIWLAAFYPEGAIALKALQAVGINL